MVRSVVIVPDPARRAVLYRTATGTSSVEGHSMGTGNGRPDPQPSQATVPTGVLGSTSRQRDGGMDGVRGPPDEVLTFPRLRRLELDELLGQLVERAQEVMGTQGRLRGLLRANQLVAGSRVAAVLRHVVEAARELVGARYAALGRDRAGRRSRRVHPRRHARRGRRRRSAHLPQGKGLLGALIADPYPIRLTGSATILARRASPRPSADVQLPGGADPGARGGVRQPLPRREHHGAFSAEDEQLATALAATAAIAIDNARLYEAARSRGEWLAASARITRQLLCAEPGRPAADHRRRSLRDRRADLVAVLLPVATTRAACASRSWSAWGPRG